MTAACAVAALATLSPRKWVVLVAMSACIVIFFLVYTRDTQQHCYEQQT